MMIQRYLSCFPVRRSRALPSLVGSLLAVALAWPVMSRAASAGFVDHGVPAPIANARGVVSTTDGQGRDVVLSWLQDHRGGYALLMVDAQTGEARQFPIDFSDRAASRAQASASGTVVARAVAGEGAQEVEVPVKEADEPFAVHLSSRNRFYTLFNRHLVEFDVATRQLVTQRLPGKVRARTAMSLTEDRQGRIWAATYPDNTLFAYEVGARPEEGRLSLQGTLGQERWDQYPRSVAADAYGWIYVGVGMKASQLYAFHPGDGLRRRLLPENERLQTTAEVVQSRGDVVFARNGAHRYQLAQGRISQQLPDGSPTQPSAVLTGAQNLVHRQFPSGRRLVSLDLRKGELVTQDAAGKAHRVRFRYETDGAALTYVCATEAGQVCGGTRFPMALFTLDPAASAPGFRYQPLARQPNLIVPVGGQLYVAAYPGGMLFEQALSGSGFGPAAERLAMVAPRVNRPHAMVVQPRTGQVIMGGTPEYGHAGGGLMFWRRQADGRPAVQTLPDRRLVPGHSAQSMLLLSGGGLLVGTTRQAGTGGEQAGVASAVLYLLDPASADKKVLWSGMPVPGVTEITDLVEGDDGLVYGIAGSRWLFRFNPRTRQLVGKPENFGRGLGAAAVFAQGTRAFVKVPQAPGRVGGIHVLLLDGVARLNPQGTPLLERVATSPVEITAGGAHAGGRIYFASHSHLYSWQVP